MESQFVAELKHAITAAHHASTTAPDADRAYLHRRRLANLLRLASDHDIDTTTWVPADVLAALHDDDLDPAAPAPGAAPDDAAPAEPDPPGSSRPDVAPAAGPTESDRR